MLFINWLLFNNTKYLFKSITHSRLDATHPSETFKLLFKGIVHHGLGIRIPIRLESFCSVIHSVECSRLDATHPSEFNRSVKLVIQLSVHV